MREAWLAEAEALFKGPEIPSRRQVLFSACRVLLAGVREAATITAGAALLGTSRRALRDTMKHHGVYGRWAQGRGPALAGPPVQGALFQP